MRRIGVKNAPAEPGTNLQLTGTSACLSNCLSMIAFVAAWATQASAPGQSVPAAALRPLLLKKAYALSAAPASSPSVPAHSPSSASS